MFVRSCVLRICHLAILFATMVCGGLIPVASLAQHVGETTQATPPTTDQSGDLDNILNLDIEQLAKTPVVVPSMDIEVTSVTKQTSTVGRSAAAIFVITPEMIRRSGVTSIPEALRMVPGMEVACIDSNKWAITCRGFNERFANKLLVLIDGRSVYEPVSSGVIWNTQDYILEDIERIEVIRGPGGTLWGANAVNGVINIITKNAKDTQGAYTAIGGGTHEKFFDSVRYGGQIGGNGYYRIYGKHFERGQGIDPTGAPADDASRQGQFGFRVDWKSGCGETDHVTIQGDHYISDAETRDTKAVPSFPFTPPYNEVVSGIIKNTGQNLLFRWRHIYDEDSEWTLQAYYDQCFFTEPLMLYMVKTNDIDFQYRFLLTDRHKITCGAGFRNVYTKVIGKDHFAFYFTPPIQTLNTSNQFIQDEISLSEDLLTMTLGCKLEQNPYTGLEYQPSIRVLWTPDRRHSAWGAISRAVRTPSRVERSMVLTLPFQTAGAQTRLFGSPAFGSEDLIAYELGYRAQATDRFSWDIATFYNVYDHLRSTEMIGPPFPEPIPPPFHLIVPLQFANGASAETYGVELTGNWTLSDRWRLYAQYTYLEVDTNYPKPQNGENTDPRNQIYLRSSWNLRNDIEFDLIARWVGWIPGTSFWGGNSVPGYATIDMRFGRKLTKNLELAIVGQNLVQAGHFEFNQTVDTFTTPPTEVPRGVYGSLTWRR